MFTEHDRIALSADLADEGSARGDVGTVIGVHGLGGAYTVEFVTVGGRTVAITTLASSQLRALCAEKMHQTAPLAAV